MICELNNKLERANCYIFNSDLKDHIRKEVYLSEFLLTLFITLFITIFIAWWMLPYIWFGKYLNPKFVCSKYIEE
jgi:hypothetical protein